jgi:hypothetical protein
VNSDRPFTLTLDRSGLLVASIPGVLPPWAAIELDDTAIDADYRKRIIDVVREFKAQGDPAALTADPSRR